MPSLATLPFLPRGRALRRYRANLREQITDEPATRLLGRLLSLPLGLAPLPDPAAVLALRQPVGLYGPLAGGRSLALLQTVSRWVASSEDAPILYLPLPEVDNSDLPPQAIVTEAFHAIGMPNTFADGGMPGALLIDDWELLTTPRRAIWQQFLTTTAPRWSALRVIVALPLHSAWPAFDTLRITGPTSEQAEAILQHLLPHDSVAPIITALAELPGLGPTPSLADLILLSLTYPLSGLPNSRAQLYARAFTIVQPLVEELQAVPTSLLSSESDLAQQRTWSNPVVGRILLRHYRLARELASGTDPKVVLDLPADVCSTVVPLATGMLNDPSPLLGLLWGRQLSPDRTHLSTIINALREAPDRAPIYGLRLIEQLITAARPVDEAWLTQLAPALPRIFIAASHIDEPRTLTVLALLTPHLDQPHQLWLTLIDHPEAPDGLRWAAADQLIVKPYTIDQLGTPPTHRYPSTLMVRAYLAAMGSPSTRATLAVPPLYDAVTMLLTAPIAGKRSAQAAALIMADPQLPMALRILAVPAVDSQPLIERIASDSAPELRQATLVALARGEPTEALASFGRVLARPESSIETRIATLNAITAITHQSAAATLIRAIITIELPLRVRMHAVTCLVQRADDEATLLRRLLATTTLIVGLRAVVARQIGHLGIGAALPELSAILTSPGSPLLRRAATMALADLGRSPTLRAAVTTALIAGLRHSATDAILGEQIVYALGQTGSTEVMAPLTALLAPRLAELLHQNWLRVAPALEQTSADAWVDLPLAESLHLSLIDILAEGDTLADPPSRIEELVERQAIRLAAAAAAALAELGSSAELRKPVIDRLRQSLYNEQRTEVIRALLKALGQVSDPAGELQAIFALSSAHPNLSWLAIECLGSHPRTFDTLRQRLEQDSDEPFVQAMITTALGNFGRSEALPVLYRVACATKGDPRLRSAAVSAITRSSDPEAIRMLVAIAADSLAPSALRVIAATALPVELSTDARVTIRQALRVERLVPEVALALQRALARTGDHEAITQLLHLIQSNSGVKAITVIDAIAEVKSADIAPLLVRISQNALAPAGVRLAAVEALLQVDRQEHLPLLNEYLRASAPPLRMQAHAILTRLLPHDQRLSSPLSDRSAPLALRLQALAHVVTYAPDSPLLTTIVTTANEHPQVRMAAAAALIHSTHPDAVVSLVAMLKPGEQADVPVLRRRCCLSLGVIAHQPGPHASTAYEQLASIVLDPAQPVAHRHWATEALLDR